MRVYMYGCTTRPTPRCIRGTLDPSHAPGMPTPCTQTASLKVLTLLDVCVSSLHRGHANFLSIVRILTDDPRRESGCTQTASLIAYAPASGDPYTGGLETGVLGKWSF